MKRTWMIVAAIALAALAVGAAFYGGMKLGQNQVVKDPMKYLAGGGAFSVQVEEGRFPGGPGGDFQMEGGQIPGARGEVRGMRAVDTITAIDGSTITLNTSDGEVKVNVSDTTYVQKYMSVSIADLAVGDTVVVSGSKNDDGSINARSIRVMTGLGFSEDMATPTP